MFGRLAKVLAIAAVAAGLAAAAASAQSYPTKSVRLLIAFPPGGSIDTLGRILAQKLGEVWGQNIVVENRPGAGGNLGAAAAAQAAPDGYTLHFGAQTLAVNVTIAPYQNLDPARDFEPIILVAGGADVLVVPLDSQFHSLADLIGYAKAHPGELNYGSLGVGTSAHLSTLLFTELTGIKLQHVPYTGFSQATTDLIAGRLAFWIPTLGGTIGNIQGGKVRALAISGPARSQVLPDVPTFKEQGVEFGESSWYALFAPKGTPKEIIAKVNGDVEHVLTLPDVKARGVTLGYRFVGGAPDKLGAFLKSETEKWAEIAKRAGLAAK
jgi:tripartite-type tricarboxylate transporter receptor subunit TctC